MNERKNKAFTLIELIVVIIIIGILATLGLPQFTVMRERALTKEAMTNLKLMAAAEKIYRMENPNQVYSNCQCLCAGTGANCCDNPTNGCNYFLKLSLNPRNWTYGATTAGADFTASADRVDTAPNPYRDCVYTYIRSRDDADGEPDPNSATNCP